MKAQEVKALVELNDRASRAIQDGILSAERLGYRKPHDIGICIKVALEAEGLQITWARGEKKRFLTS